MTSQTCKVFFTAAEFIFIFIGLSSCWCQSPPESVLFSHSVITLPCVISSLGAAQTSITAMSVIGSVLCWCISIYSVHSSVYGSVILKTKPHSVLPVSLQQQQNKPLWGLADSASKLSSETCTLCQEVSKRTKPGSLPAAGSVTAD